MKKNQKGDSMNYEHDKIKKLLTLIDEYRDRVRENKNELYCSKSALTSLMLVKKDELVASLNDDTHYSMLAKVKIDLIDKQIDAINSESRKLLNSMSKKIQDEFIQKVNILLEGERLVCIELMTWNFSIEKFYDIEQDMKTKGWMSVNNIRTPENLLFYGLGKDFSDVSKRMEEDLNSANFGCVGYLNSLFPINDSIFE